MDHFQKFCSLYKILALIKQIIIPWFPIKFRRNMKLFHKNIELIWNKHSQFRNITEYYFVDMLDRNHLDLIGTGCPRVREPGLRVAETKHLKLSRPRKWNESRKERLETTGPYTAWLPESCCIRPRECATAVHQTDKLFVLTLVLHYIIQIKVKFIYIYFL